MPPPGALSDVVPLPASPFPPSERDAPCMDHAKRLPNRGGPTVLPRVSAMASTPLNCPRLWGNTAFAAASGMAILFHCDGSESRRARASCQPLRYGISPQGNRWRWGKEGWQRDRWVARNRIGRMGKLNPIPSARDEYALVITDGEKKKVGGSSWRQGQEIKLLVSSRGWKYTPWISPSYKASGR